MNTETIRNFFRKNDFLKYSSLEKQAELPAATLTKVMNGDRELKPEQIERLAKILIPLGLEDIIRAKVVSIINNKGGVAKTTTAVNLGGALANLDKKVLLIDFDPQGNLSQHFGVDEPRLELKDAIVDDVDIDDIILKYSENLYFLPSSLALDHVTIELNGNPSAVFSTLSDIVKKVGERFDYIFIDCPPSMSVLNQSALYASDKVIIPIHPSKFSYNGLDSVLSVIKRVQQVHKKVDILGLLFVMVERNQQIYKGYSEELRKQSRYVFETEIPKNVDVAKAVEFERTVVDSAPQSVGAEAYIELAKEFISIM